MLYSFRFTIPKRTPKENLFRQTIELRKGVIYKVIITIPFGHMGICGIQIRYGEHVVFPFGGEDFVYGNNEIIEDIWYWEIEKDKDEFQLCGYNNSTYLDHSFIVRFIVLPPEVIPPEIMPRKISKVIEELLEGGESAD